MKPSCITCVIVPSKAKPEYKSPPETMPMKSEEYTSFVTSARKMARSGGKMAHQVPKKRFSVRIVSSAFASFALNDWSCCTLSA